MHVPNSVLWQFEAAADAFSALVSPVAGLIQGSGFGYVVGLSLAIALGFFVWRIVKGAGD